MFDSLAAHLPAPVTRALSAPFYTPPKPKAPDGSQSLTDGIAIFLFGVGIAGFIGLVVIGLMMFFADEHRLGKIGTRLGMWFAGATVVGIAGGVVTLTLGV